MKSKKPSSLRVTIMSEVRVITSNFLDAKAVVKIEDARLKFASDKSSLHFKTLSCLDIKTLMYKKSPKAFEQRARGSNLFLAFINVFTAVKGMKRKNQLEFDVHFKDGKNLVGVTSMDAYFDLQNAWLETR